ncbi:Golgi transport complex subunit 5-domain-containing protein [Cryomyces antarcticus]
MTDTSEPSYIDYEAFLSPSFSAPSFANSLVLATNDPSDAPLDLSTPLSRVLFDVQEIDTHIDTLTTKSALPLLEYTKDHVEASKHVLQEVESRVASLTDGYKRLEKDVIERYEAAEQVRLAAERLCQTVKIGRSVARCLLLGRQLEAQMSELTGSLPAGGKREDYRAMVRSANTLLSLRQLFAANRPGEEGHGLDRINVIITLRSGLIEPMERTLLTRAQQIIREFSTSSLLASNVSQLSTYAQTEDTKSRATSALTTLYLLSPTKTNTTANFEPILLVSALQNYLQTALTSSLAALTRALATLPTLDRTLLEISARCQNIVALEALLESIKPPPHPLLTDTVVDVPTEPLRNFLQPLLTALDTSSLPSYFWRSLASALSSRVQDIMNRGGVSARTLRSNRDRVRDAVRECVNRGSHLPTGSQGAGKDDVRVVGNWEREAAVMVGSIVGVLGR